METELIITNLTLNKLDSVPVETLSVMSESDLPPLPFQEIKSKLKITEVRMVRPRKKNPWPKYTPAPGAWSADGAEVANPMSIYPKYKARRSLFMAGDMGPTAVQILTNKGVSGIGYGGPGANFVIEKHLTKLLIGEDPFDVERLWDIMWRSTLYYGRKGLVVHAISAVDNALWEMKVSVSSKKEPTSKIRKLEEKLTKLKAENSFLKKKNRNQHKRIKVHKLGENTMCQYR